MATSLEPKYWLTLFVIVIKHAFLMTRSASCEIHDYRPSHSPPFSKFHGFMVNKLLVFQCSCDHQTVSMPQISLIGSALAKSAKTGMVFIGLPSHITLFGNSHSVSPLYHFVASVPSQIVVNQLISKNRNQIS